MSDLFLIRADGGVRLGFGHVMRSLALAQAWQRSGGRALFALAESAPSLESRLSDHGIEIVRLDVVPGSSADAARTAALARERRAAWIIADGYGFGDQWQRAIKDSGFQLLLWDDYGQAKSYAADFVLNQNLHATSGMYARREPYTQLLLGTRYAQLRDDFLEWRDWKREIASVATKVLVTMGGADPQNVTGQVVQALASLQDVEAVVVAGGSNPNIEELRSVVAAQPNLQLAVDVPNMPDLMAWADIAVSASGSTCLELAFMGLPAVVVPIASNQEAAAQALAGSGLAMAVAPEMDSQAPQLCSAIRALLSTPGEMRSTMSAGLCRLVDGRGGRRVVRLLQPAKVSLRRVAPDDCALLWHWANDPAVRSWSFCKDPIPWDDHVRWFASRCGNPECIWYIACDGQLSPLGQVRIDLESPHYGTVNISVAPERRGQGMAARMLRAVLDEASGTTVIGEVHAYVKPGNAASVRSFERAGFTRVGLVAVGANPTIHFVSRPSEHQATAQLCRDGVALEQRNESELSRGGQPAMES